MQAAAHSADFAKKAHIPQEVAREFEDADQRMSPEKRGYLRMPKDTE